MDCIYSLTSEISRLAPSIKTPQSQLSENQLTSVSKMAETYAELEELHKISQRLYPSLPPDEAYLALNKRMLSRALDVASCR